MLLEVKDLVVNYGAIEALHGVSLGINEGELVAADAFEAAAPKMYENPALRPLLPSLWQIKLGLEEKLGVDLGDWRSEEDALADFRTYGIVAAEGRAD